MNTKKILIILLIMIFSLAILYYGIDFLREKEKVVGVYNNYFYNIQEKKFDEAMNNVYIVENNGAVNKRSIYIDMLKEITYNSYKINKVDKINKNIFIVYSTINTNADSLNIDKSIFKNEKFNVYVCKINGEFKIIYDKVYIPSHLYSDINDVPNNY